MPDPFHVIHLYVWGQPSEAPLQGACGATHATTGKQVLTTTPPGKVTCPTCRTILTAEQRDAHHPPAPIGDARIGEPIDLTVIPPKAP